MRQTAPIAVFALLATIAACSLRSSRKLSERAEAPVAAVKDDFLGSTEAPAVYDCVTTCGLQVTGTADCKAFQDAEDRILKSYALYVKAVTYPEACLAVAGWHVFVVYGLDPGKFWYEGQEMYGMTIKDRGIHKIFVGSKLWEQSALAHEIGHVIDFDLHIGETSKHPGWEERGYCKAIDAVSRLPENC